MMRAVLVHVLPKAFQLLVETESVKATKFGSIHSNGTFAVALRVGQLNQSTADLQKPLAEHDLKSAAACSRACACRCRWAKQSECTKFATAFAVTTAGATAASDRRASILIKGIASASRSAAAQTARHQTRITVVENGTHILLRNTKKTAALSPKLGRRGTTRSKRSKACIVGILKDRSLALVGSDPVSACSTAGGASTPWVFVSLPRICILSIP